jgi:hypothetical protein
MAVLAASHDGRVVDAATSMIRMRESIEPKAGSVGRFDGGYLDLVQELEQRGWLPEAAAAHARRRPG